jgi:glycerol-3-phosphate dehydrogenase
VLIRRTAPHLVRALPQLMPLLPGLSTAAAAKVRTGYHLGDLLRRAAGTPASVLPRSRRVNAADVRRYAPTVNPAGLRGGLVFWDGQLIDDARLVVCLARTAAVYGARILTRCTARDVTGAGAVLHDELTGSRFSVDARMVINATGVWSAQVAGGIRLRPSRGTHLVFSRETFEGLQAGLMIPVPGRSTRFVFALPAEEHVYVGLTDVDAPGEIPDEPLASEPEIDFLLDVIGGALRNPLGRQDLLGSFAGLRPLLDNGRGHPADVSRKHAVLSAQDGLVTIVGGKLTTYRRMAQAALDTALARSALDARPCRTRRLPLVGAADAQTLNRVAAPARLVRRYGTEAAEVLAQAGGDPAALRPITDTTGVTLAELRFGVRHEGALDESDLLDRRTRIGLSAAHREAALPAARRALN